MPGFKNKCSYFLLNRPKKKKLRSYINSLYKSFRINQYILYLKRKNSYVPLVAVK